MRRSFALAFALLALEASLHGAVASAAPPSPSASPPAAAAPPTATAAPSAPDDAAARALALKKRGDDAMDSGNPAEAYAAYNEASKLSPDPALIFNKGRALQALTQYPEALAQIEEFAAAASPELKARVPGLENLLAQLRAKVTTLTVACDVSGARVRLRDRALATTPVQGPLRVNAGPATLEVLADGYYPYRRDFTLPGGGMATIEVHLLSRATSGTLLVTSAVTGADVVVDGHPVGRVPLETVLLAGTHELRLTKDGFEPTTTTTVLGAGERKSVTIPLDAVRPITSKWWFWTAIGVAVAGGVAAVYALTTEKKADSGTIAPGQVGAALHF